MSLAQLLFQLLACICYTVPHLIHVFPTLLNPSAWDRANLRLSTCPIGSVVTYRIGEHMLALNYLLIFI